MAKKYHVDGTEICKIEKMKIEVEKATQKITTKLELSKHTFIIEILVRLADGVAFFDFRLT